MDVKDANAKELISALESRGYDVNATKRDHAIKEKYPKLFKLISGIDFEDPAINEKCMDTLYGSLPYVLCEVLEKELPKRIF